jgi:predicted ATPase/DNA-binding XRE family transcriptional regulator
MVEQPALGFAGLLRQLRAEAKLTQEELAEAAGLSPRSVSDLERGINRTARKDTAGLLADALSLTGQPRALFIAAARGRVSAEDVLAAMRGQATGAVAAVQPVAPHNLPAPLTSCLGREEVLARLEALLRQARLVTLTGTGGAGKTRLAVECAIRLVQQFPDGAWLADLAGIASPTLVAAQVMEALGVRQEGELPVLEALRFRLRSAELLLVLDNCEHLLDTCAELAGALLASAPGLRVLATSREPLGVPGEVICPVPPLDLPPDLADEQARAEAPAVRLFLERGSAARGGVRGEVAPVAVAERICRKLDGLPLAIELAAARLGTLSAAEIETHLTDRFRFLANRRPARNPRHQALQAAMDWSYDLLSASERQVLGELSVFAGTFGLEQAAAVCSGGDQVAALEVIDRLASKSLVTAEPSEDGTRYRLLETVRQYAADRLAEAGGTDAARQRHALTFLRLAERERDLAVLSREHDNFRVALEWSLAAGSLTGPQLALELGSFWLVRGLLQEGRAWLKRALGQRPADGSLRAGLLRLLGAVLLEGGDLSQAESTLSEGLEVAVAAGVLAERARIRVELAEIYQVHTLPGGSGAGALEECQAAIAILDAEGDLGGLADAWLLVGKLRFDRGEWPADRDASEQAMAYARQSGNHRAWIRASHFLAGTYATLPVPADAAVDRVEELLQAVRGEPWAEAGVLMALSTLYACVGRIGDARAAVTRARSISRSFGSKLGLALGAIPAGVIELISGDPATAERYWREGYEAFRSMGERGYRGNLAALLGEALYVQGRLDEAQQMTEEAEAAGGPNDIFIRIRWRSTRAKVLAQRGRFPAARRLVHEAEALIAPTSWSVEYAHVLMAKADVHWLAGERDQAEASARAALQIYEDWHVAPFAELIRTALASLATHPDAGSA